MGINADDPRPPYQQIADELRERIGSGLLASGTRLPSTRQLMDEFDVANQTVQRAVGILRSEDLVHGVAGRGVFVRETATSANAADSEPSPRLLAEQLDAVTAEMRRLDERVALLEARSEPEAECGG